MGIDKLKSTLVKAGAMVPYVEDVRKKYVFIDFNCLFFSRAHVSTDIDDLKRNINIFIDKLYKDNLLRIFYDSGSVWKKRVEHVLRKEKSDKYYQSVKTRLMKANIINSEMDIIPAVPELKTIATTDNEILISTNVSHSKEIYTKVFSTKFNLDAQFRNDIFYEILTMLKDAGHNVISKKNIDAEFYMCMEAKRYYSTCGIWPAFFTKDQDLIALAAYNSPIPETYFLFDNDWFILHSNNISKNIIILSLLFNKSDYFPGVYGYLLLPEKLTPKVLNVLSESYNATVDDIALLAKKILMLTVGNKFNYIYPREIHNGIVPYIEGIILYISSNMDFYKDSEYKLFTIDNLVDYLLTI